MTSTDKRDQPQTDLQRGVLSAKVREAFLKQWGLPETTTDDEVLLAIGIGHF